MSFQNKKSETCCSLENGIKTYVHSEYILV